MSQSTSTNVPLGSPPPPTKASVYLDLIRALAAFAVVWGHARAFLYGGSLTNQVLASATGSAVDAAKPAAEGEGYGHQAVIVFFVLSGFLVGGSVVRALQAKRWAWKPYLINRLTRLWIVLLPALLIGFALDKFGMLHFAGLHTIYDGPTGQTMVLPHLADRLTPATLGANAIFSQNILTTTLGSNIALWSLTNEFWYYLLFPFALLAIWPGMKAITRIVSAVLFVGILIYVGREIAEYFLLWLFGAGVACLPLVKITPQKAALFSVVVVVIYAITLVGQRKLHLPYFLNDFVASVAFSLMLFGLLHNTGAAKQGIGFHLSRFGAGMSYSLYLTHLPIIVLIVAATIHPWHEYASFKASLPMLAVVIVAALAFAAAFWFLFESRTPALRKWITKQLATD